jgi:hypothetical protein
MRFKLLLVFLLLATSAHATDKLFTDGEGIDSTEGGATFTVDCELASTSNKGCASFNSSHFSVTSGAVSATNAPTSTALATNPADCSANQFANTIAANGDLTCAAIADADVPDTIVIDHSSTGTLRMDQSTTPSATTEGLLQWDTDNDLIVVGDGASTATFYPNVHTTDTGPSPDCSGTTTYQDGEGSCDTLDGVEDFETATDDAVLMGNGTTFDSKAVPDCDDSSGNHLNYDTATNAWSCGTSVSVDVSDDTNLTAGRSLTLTGDDVLADAELYTDSKCMYIEDPEATDDLLSVWWTNQAVTLTSIWCETDQTVTLDFEIAAAAVNGSAVTCNGTPDTSLGGTTAMGADSELDLAIATASGTPTYVSICFEYTKDD